MAAIAVTGASGFMGRAITDRLVARGHPVLRVARRGLDPVDGATVRICGGYADGDGFGRAVSGADTLMFIPAHESETRVADHCTAIDAAVAAGVRRIVYLSFIGAETSSFTLGRDHHLTEEHIRASGVDWTFVRMNFYLDFMPFFAGPDGVIRGPAGEGRISPVARTDLADVCVALLLDPSASGRTIDVSGHESFSLVELAARLSAVSGKPIRYVVETLEEAYASRAPTGAADWQIEAWVSTYTAIASGELDRPDDAVQRLAGHTPTTLEALFANSAEAFAHIS